MFDFVIRDNAASLGVDKEHLSRLETALGDDMVLADFREHTSLGCKNQVAVVCDLPAAGAESVAIELGSDQCAVREDDIRRAIPRLNQCVVVLVERLDVGVERVVVLPSRREHHEQSVREAASGEMQQFQALVEGA